MRIFLNTSISRQRRRKTLNTDFARGISSFQVGTMKMDGFHEALNFCYLSIGLFISSGWDSDDVMSSVSDVVSHHVIITRTKSKRSAEQTTATDIEQSQSVSRSDCRGWRRLRFPSCLRRCRSPQTAQAYTQFWISNQQQISPLPSSYYDGNHHEEIYNINIGSHGTLPAYDYDKKRS
jgi:hypothetical protein